MKNYLKYITILTCLVFLGCDKDTEYVDSKDPASIIIQGVEGNTILVHTTESFQLQLSVLPKDAELPTPIEYIYSSEDKDVFAVSDKGLITATGVGESVLTITSKNYPDLKTLAIIKVTDRTYAVASINLDEKFKEYVMSVGSAIDISSYVTVMPENATNKELSFSSSDNDIVSISDKGLIEAKKLGEVQIKINAIDGSNISTECKIIVKEINYVPLDRSGWTITTSHALPVDAAISNSTQSLIDGDIKTCLSMVKPGKSFGGISVSDKDEVYFIVDMKKELDFDYLNISHRMSNTNEFLRPYGCSILGSNDGENFTAILTDVDGKPNQPEFRIDIPLEVKYRYVKVIYTRWNTKSGSTLQLAELNIGGKSF